MAQRVVLVAHQRLEAGEVVQEGCVARVKLQPFLQQRLGLAVALRIPGRDACEGELPGRDLERLAAHAADREHGRAVLRGAGTPTFLRVVEEDTRADGRVEALAVDGERGPSGDDDVELFVVPRAGAGLVMLLDDHRTGVRGVGVDAERLNAERAPHGTPLQFASDDRDRLDVGDPGDLHALALRSASSTIGSSLVTPSMRSSRLAAPAQSANAFSRSSVYPRVPSRWRSSLASVSSTSTQSSSGVAPKSSSCREKRRRSSAIGRSWSSIRRSTTVSDSF